MSISSARAILCAAAAIGLAVLLTGPAVAVTSGEVMASYVQKAKLIATTAEPELVAVAPSKSLTNQPGLVDYSDPNTGEVYVFDTARAYVEEYFDPRVNDQPPAGSGVTTPQVVAQAEALLRRACGNPAFVGDTTMTAERRIVSPALSAKGVSTPGRSECYILFSRYVGGIKMPEHVFMIFDGRSGRLVSMSQNFADVRVSLTPSVDRATAIGIVERAVHVPNPSSTTADLEVHDDFNGTQELIWDVTLTTGGNEFGANYNVAIRATDGAVLWGNGI